MEKHTYVSLFSCAGVGCYGFKMADWECVSSCEIREDYLDIQRNNKKCDFEDQYICGDISDLEIQSEIVLKSKAYLQGRDLDVVFATPPCQSISLLNHHSGTSRDMERNSLVLDSLSLIKSLSPKVFILENVRRFLDTFCQDRTDVCTSIRDAIYRELGDQYKIHHDVLNLKNYGSQSSRTRTIVIGIRKTECIDPSRVIPPRTNPKSLGNLIGHLEPLTEMGQMSKTDVWHRFRPYKPHMRSWIENLLPGENAYDNTDPERRPHRIVDGVYIENRKSASDKYKRVLDTKVAPCVHTRSDTFSSQNTIHPFEDRVFSIRELMLMMSIPSSFRWTAVDDETIRLDWGDREYNKLERKIRTVIGEAVPTMFIFHLATKLSFLLDREELS